VRIEFERNNTALRRVYSVLNYRSAILNISLHPGSSKQGIVKIRPEIKIGIFSIIVIVASIWGYQFLKGNNLLVRSVHYFAQFDNIDQLPMNSEILLRGKRVGTVTDIFFENNMEFITIQLNVERNIKLPKDAEVHIMSTGIAGQKAVEIRFTKGCTGDDCAQVGDYLKGVNKGFIESLVTKDEVDEYLKRIGDGLGDVIDTLGERFKDQEETNEFLESFKRLGHTIRNLERITARMDIMMAEAGPNIAELTGNVNKATANLDEKMGSIGNSLENLQEITEGLAAQNIPEQISGTIDRADQSLDGLTASLNNFNQTLQMLNEGEGTLGKLLTDPEIADNLNRGINNLNLLLQDVRLNPHRYTHFKVTLFGRGNRDEYELPEFDPADDQD